MELCAKRSSDLSAQTDRNQEFYTQIAPQSCEVNSLCCLFYFERSSRGSIRLQTSCQSGDRWDRGLLGVWASNRLASVPRSVRPFVRLPEYSQTPAPPPNRKSLQNGTLRKNRAMHQLQDLREERSMLGEYQFGTRGASQSQCTAPIRLEAATTPSHYLLGGATVLA